MFRRHRLRIITMLAGGATLARLDESPRLDWRHGTTLASGDIVETVVESAGDGARGRDGVPGGDTRELDVTAFSSHAVTSSV